MGLYDRDYYQDDEPSHGGYFADPRTGQRMMVTNIVIVTVAFWIADHLGEPRWLSSRLDVSGDLFRHPLEFYRLLTYGLTHSRIEAGGILHILFNMFMLWMAGREVEAKLGRFEFLRFYAVALVVASLAWLAIVNATGRADTTFLVGASGAVMAVLFLNIVTWPRRQFALFGIWPMPAWKLGLGIVVVESILMLASLAAPTAGASDVKKVAYEAHLAGAAFGAAYAHFHWSLGRFAFWDVRRWLDRLKPRPKLKVHDPETYYHDLDKEADALLAKIHKYGESSLTAEERRKLEDYSRRMRQKHR